MLGAVSCACLPSSKEVETGVGVPGALWPDSLAESINSGFSERPCLTRGGGEGQGTPDMAHT